MSDTIVLTPLLHSRLDAVARRVRRLRIARGLSLVALTLILTAAAALLTDHFLPLPAFLRLALFGAWVLLGATLFLTALVIPLRRRLALAELAAAIEQQYPELAERLTTTVELAENTDDYHGSRALLALLVSDTAQRTAHLDFLSAVSSRGALAFGSAALAVTVLALAPAVVWTREYLRLGQRFFVAWHTLERGASRKAAPPIRAILPVELAADSPAATITAPVYARQTVAEQHLLGVVDLSALQHSEVRFDCRFTRPAVAAFVEWTVIEIKEAKDGSKPEPKTTTLPLALSEDRRSATLTLPAQVTGNYRLVLEAEHGIRTELEAKTLTVRVDQPPQIVKFAGKEELQAVLPYDRLLLEITAGDDIGVARADLEYRVNADAVKTEAMRLTGANLQEATAKLVLPLAGKVKEGDEISYRIRIQDNRPKEYGGPQAVYYPADRWLKLKVARQAAPLREQEIIAQRDDVDKRLDALHSDLLREQRGVYKLRQESRDAPALVPEQANNLKQLRQNNRSTENALRNLAHEAEANPALERLGRQADGIADRELRQSDAALQRAAEKKTAAPQRDDAFQTANKELTSALKKLEELKKANDKLAQERLERQQVDMLAEREKQLAERAAELASKEPMRAPKAREELEQLKREQAEIAVELQRLSEQSEVLRNALEAARADDKPENGPKDGTPHEGNRQTGQAVQEAQKQMEQAQQKLTQGQAQGAQVAMQQAAQSLQQAAAPQSQPAQPGQPNAMSHPSDFGAASGGRPDPSIFGPDAQKYAGKTWGELPGELRTKIVQDMKAKYGDDYGHMIQLYFEQLADTKKK